MPLFEWQKKRATDEEDYDAAHEAKLREAELVAKIEQLPKGPAPSSCGSAGANLKSIEAELARVREEKKIAIASENYDAANDLKLREADLLSRVQELQKPAARQGSANTAHVENQLQQIRAKKRAAIEAEDYDAANAAKEREKELEAELQRLQAAGTNGDAANQGAAGASDAEIQAIESELQEVRNAKKIALQAEDYDAAHLGKLREQELVTKLEGLKRLGSSCEGEKLALEEELKRVRAQKVAAAAAEDYDAAAVARQRETELLAQLGKVGQATVGKTTSSEAERRFLEEELKKVQAEKEKAIAAEDYDGAHKAKQRLTQLTEQLSGLK